MQVFFGEKGGKEHSTAIIQQGRGEEDYKSRPIFFTSAKGPLFFSLRKGRRKSVISSFLRKKRNIMRGTPCHVTFIDTFHLGKGKGRGAESSKLATVGRSGKSCSYCQLFLSSFSPMYICGTKVPLFGKLCAGETLG